MIAQAFALIVLKLRLMRSTWTGMKTVSTVVLGFLLLMGGLVSLAVSAAAFYVAAYTEVQLTAFRLLGVLDAMILIFLFLWFWGLMMELQRSDTIDFRKMMYLPVSLPMIFSLNFIASLFSPSLLFFVPVVLALIAGLTVKLGPHMLLGIPLTLMFFLMVGAWAYYLRGLIAIVMQNKRRRRAILTLIPIAFILFSQAPNLIVTLSRGNIDTQGWSDPQIQDAVIAANIYLPFGWLPYGVYALDTGKPTDALICLLGLTLFTAAGLHIGYRATLRYYATGATENNGPRKAVPGKKLRRAFTLRKLPLLDEETSALTTAAFLSFIRHPNIRMQLFTPIVFGGMMLFIFSRNEASDALGQEVPAFAFLPVFLLAWPFLCFAFVFFNQFGIDREAFRGMVLLPARRHKILLAKNIALFPLVITVALLCLIGANLVFRMPPISFATALLQMLQLFFAFSIAGNFFSLYLPYRIHTDMMRRSGSRGLLILMNLLSAVFTGVLMLPIAIGQLLDGYTVGIPLLREVSASLLLSVVLLLVTAAAWVLTLTPAGDILLTREQKILATLVKDRD